MLRVVLVRRELGRRTYAVLMGSSAVLSILVSIVVVALASSMPPQTLLFKVGESYANLNTLRYFSTLTIIGLGLTVAYSAKLWNIGAEGQLVVGAIGATAVALFTPLGHIPVLGIVVGLILASLLGLLWGLAAILLKLKLGLNEVLVTLLLNYIAYYTADYLVYGPWRGIYVHGYPETDLIPQESWLLRVYGYSFSYPVLLTALILVVLVYMVMKFTRLGIAIRAYGSNPRAVELSGISSFRTAVAAFVISAALAGLAGGFELFAVHRKLVPGYKIGAGLGYISIIVAWLSGLNPLLVPLSAYYVSGLMVFRYVLQIGTVNIGDAFAQFFIGIALLSTLATSSLARYKIKVVRS